MNKMNNKKKFELKELSFSDLELVLNWRNQEFIRKMMHNSVIISMEQHIEWFKKMEVDSTKKTLVFYCDGIPQGILQLQQIDYTHQTCEWGFYIGNSLAPKGTGTFLGYVSLQYIFHDLKLRKVTGVVLSFNEKSIQFHKKLGFIQEGLLRNQVIKEDYLCDIYLFGLLATEWEEMRTSIKNKIEGRFL